jgi:hypothetical protein
LRLKQYLVLFKNYYHQFKSDEYEQPDFVEAFFIRRKPVEVALKKQVERAYLSCLAGVKRADNKKSSISLREKEMEYKLVELEKAEKMEEE